MVMGYATLKMLAFSCCNWPLTGNLFHSTGVAMAKTMPTSGFFGMD